MERCEWKDGTGASEFDGACGAAAVDTGIAGYEEFHKVHKCECAYAGQGVSSLY